MDLGHFQSTSTCSPGNQKCLFCSGLGRDHEDSISAEPRRTLPCVCKAMDKACTWIKLQQCPDCEGPRTGVHTCVCLCVCVCFHVSALSCVLDTHHYPAWEKIIAAVSPHRMETHNCELNLKKTACKGKSTPPASKFNSLLPEGLSHHSLVTLTDWADTELMFKVSFKTLVKWIIRALVTSFFEDFTESCQMEMASMFLCHQLGKRSVITDRKPLH